MHSLSSQHHSFDIYLAAEFGINEAILIHHFQHWITKNKKLKRNFHEGRYWSYQTMDEICAVFPYLTFNQVEHLLEKMCTGTKKYSPILMKGNFSEDKFKRAVWYAFVDQDRFIPSDLLIFSGISEISEMQIGDFRNADRKFPKCNKDQILRTKTNKLIRSSSSSSKSQTPHNINYQEVIRQEFGGKYEEEDLLFLIARFEEQPSGSVFNLKRWAEEVLKNRRLSKQSKGDSESKINEHRKQAKELEKKLGNSFVEAGEKYVEFKTGIQIDIVAYNLPDSKWQEKFSDYADKITKFASRNTNKKVRQMPERKNSDSGFSES